MAKTRYVVDLGRKGWLQTRMLCRSQNIKERYQRDNRGHEITRASVTYMYIDKLFHCFMATTRDKMWWILGSTNTLIGLLTLPSCILINDSIL